MFLVTFCFVCIVICLYWGEYHLQFISDNRNLLINSSNRQKVVKKIIWTFIGILTLVSTVRYGFIDTYAYKGMYRAVRHNWDYVWTGAGWGIEYGWLITCYFLNYICSSPNFILFFSALLINYAYAQSIRKYSDDIVLSLWMYFCLQWLSTNNGIRQFNAAALTILAFPLLLNQEKKFKKRILFYCGYALVVILGMQWHNSVKICIPIMIAVLGRTFNFMILGIMFICLAFVGEMEVAKEVFIESAGDTKYAEMYLNKISGGMGLPRAIIMGIIPLIFAIIYFIKCKKEKITISHTDSILLNFLVIQSAFTILGIKIQILARLCFYTYFIYFLFMPKMMMFIFEKKYKNARNIAIVCYLFFFCYNVYMNYRYTTMKDFYFYVEK